MKYKIGVGVVVGCFFISIAAIWANPHAEIHEKLWALTGMLAMTGFIGIGVSSL